MKETMLPEYMRLTEEEIELAPPIIRDAVKQKTAFIAKVGNTHEMVFVCPKGLLLMSEHMKDIFEALLRKEFGVE